MKKIIVLGLTIFTILGMSSFKKKGFDPLQNSVKISENTYLEQVEISNLNWREYMHWTAKVYGKESDKYLSVLPDENVWAGKKQEPVKKFYLNHPEYNDYPVVGISYEQAVSYCEWRADRINEVLLIENGNKALSYSCRLPTKDEWEKLVKSEGMAMHGIRKDLANMLYASDDGVVHEQDITSPVESFTPSLNGYYNLVGNVAEMVIEKGIAKGGSWQHLNTDFSIEKDYNYDGPQNWLGFRCVLEIKKDAQ